MCTKPKSDNKHAEELAEKDRERTRLLKRIHAQEIEIAKLQGRLERFTAKEEAARQLKIKNRKQYASLKTVRCATISPFDCDTMASASDGYTYEIYLDAFDGLLSFLISIITKDDERNYVCTDAARKRFYRLEYPRRWVLDKDCEFLITFLDSLEPVTSKYYDRVVAMNQDINVRDQADTVKDKVYRMTLAIVNRQSNDRPLFHRRLVSALTTKIAI
jgi:hypothetical protein